MAPFGKALMVFGLLLVVIGALAWGASSLPLLDRLGRLPGDLYLRRGNFRLYFPIATSIVLSIVLTLLLALISRR